MTCIWANQNELSVLGLSLFVFAVGYKLDKIHSVDFKMFTYTKPHDEPIGRTRRSFALLN